MKATIFHEEVAGKPSFFFLSFWISLTMIRGVVQNIRFENFFIQGATIGAAISQGSGDNGSYAGTSLMEVSNIAFVNFTGYTQGGKGNRTASVSCSKVHPCFNIAFQNISLADAANGTETTAQGTCSYPLFSKHYFHRKPRE
jgi:hypothetical protein